MLTAQHAEVEDRLLEIVILRQSEAASKKVEVKSA